MRARMRNVLEFGGAAMWIFGIVAAFASFMSMLEFGRWTDVVMWGFISAGAMFVVGQVANIVGYRANMAAAERDLPSPPTSQRGVVW